MCTLYLGYEAKDELSTVIKEEVSEEVLSHHCFGGIRKLVLLSLKTILAAVFLHLLLLPLHVCNAYTIYIVCIYIHMYRTQGLGLKPVHLLYYSEHLHCTWVISTTFLGCLSFISVTMQGMLPNFLQVQQGASSLVKPYLYFQKTYLVTFLTFLPQPFDL